MMPTAEWVRLIPGLIDQHRDIAAVIFGLLVTGVTGLVGLLLRYPLQRQAVGNETFRAIISGYESLINNQAERIAHLEAEARNREDFEAELVRQVRELQLERLGYERRTDSNRGG